MMSMSFELRWEQARSTSLIQPTCLSTPRHRAVALHIPPASQPRFRFQHFRPSGHRNRHRCPVRIRLIPACSNSAETFMGSPTSRLMEGSSVTTVTSHPSWVKYVAMFQVLTQATAVAGGNGYARNSSLGRLFDLISRMGSLLVHMVWLPISMPFTTISHLTPCSNFLPQIQVWFFFNTIVNHGSRITFRYSFSSSLFREFASNRCSTCFLPA